MAAQDPAFFAELGRAASQSENYGGNTREQGFTNMVDLGDLARKSSRSAGLCPGRHRCTERLRALSGGRHLPRPRPPA